MEFPHTSSFINRFPPTQIPIRTHEFDSQLITFRRRRTLRPHTIFTANTPTATGKILSQSPGSRGNLLEIRVLFISSVSFSPLPLQSSSSLEKEIFISLKII
ncbi:hypothetical protein ACOSP7_004271 [Xanthoceras sorbifolium]